MTTRLAGLIGFPVAHSISPAFQQAAFDALGLDVYYERWATPVVELAALVTGLRDERFLGANVTVPHKEQIAALLDEVDATARRVGAVNTIFKQGTRLLGSNTDVAGFRRALTETAGFIAAGRRTVVLGAGGAARGVVLALQLEGASSICVANRHALRAARLVQDLQQANGAALTAVAWEQAVSAAGLREADLLVHCTTLGMAGTPQSDATPVSASVLHPSLLVCDIVANPLVTPLLREARKAGASCLGGLSMLVYQGAASFELWTGLPAPAPVMMAAAEQAMLAAAPAE